jgi:hypothetical protein
MLMRSGEDPEYRTCKQKSHIDKVMFGAAVARPSWDQGWWQQQLQVATLRQGQIC